MVTLTTISPSRSTLRVMPSSLKNSANGIDLAPALVASAQEEFQQSNVQFKCSEISSFSENEYYDAIPSEEFPWSIFSAISSKYKLIFLLWSHEKNEQGTSGKRIKIIWHYNANYTVII